MKKAYKIYIILTLVLSVSSCYYLKQGSYLLTQNSSARPIKALLKNPNLSKEEREFFLLVEEIRAFAHAELSLKDSNNYTQYVLLDRDYLASVVQACKDDAFVPYLWDYPFLGKMPYKGFYEVADAEAEALALKKANYDVIIRKVDAFSTLGFFSDPVFSFFKDYSVYRLAELICHEETHATIFVQNENQFNEELATFAGRQAALLFIEKKYGLESNEYAEAIESEGDAVLYVNFLKNAALRFDTIYSSELSREEKLKQKSELLNMIEKEYEVYASTVYKTEGYKQSKLGKVNNAYFELYRLYEGESEDYSKFFVNVCDSDFKKFIKTVKEISKNPNPKRNMKQVLEKLDAQKLKP